MDVQLCTCQSVEIMIWYINNGHIEDSSRITLSVNNNGHIKDSSRITLSGILIMVILKTHPELHYLLIIMVILKTHPELHYLLPSVHN